jgi:CheY-like chemotaxis protein
MARYQVLLVDDNPVVRQIVRQILEKESQFRI